MAEWIEIEVIDDDCDYGVRDMIVCSNCYWNHPNGMYKEAPENYKELNKCPVCGEMILERSEEK